MSHTLQSLLVETDLSLMMDFEDDEFSKISRSINEYFENSKPFLHIRSMNKIGTPTNLTQRSNISGIREKKNRSSSPTDELFPYVFCPSTILKQRMKSDSPKPECR